jgi:hypothetical protein
MFLLVKEAHTDFEMPTVEYVPPEPQVMAPEGADVRLAASAAATNELREIRRRIM